MLHFLSQGGGDCNSSSSSDANGSFPFYHGTIFTSSSPIVAPVVLFRELLTDIRDEDSSDGVFAHGSWSTNGRPPIKRKRVPQHHFLKSTDPSLAVVSCPPSVVRLHLRIPQTIGRVRLGFSLLSWTFMFIIWIFVVVLHLSRLHQSRPSGSLCAKGRDQMVSNPITSLQPRCIQSCTSDHFRPSRNAGWLQLQGHGDGTTGTVQILRIRSVYTSGLFLFIIHYPPFPST